MQGSACGTSPMLRPPACWRFSRRPSSPAPRCALIPGGAIVDWRAMGISIRRSMLTSMRSRLTNFCHWSIWWLRCFSADSWARIKVPSVRSIWDYYLDEFAFRFNRRHSHHRGKLFYRLLQQAVLVDPVPYSKVKKGVRGHRRARYKI